MIRFAPVCLASVSLLLAGCNMPQTQPQTVKTVTAPVTPTITPALVAATTATVEIPPVMVPKYASVAELQAAQARQKQPRKRNSRNTTSTPSADASLSPDQQAEQIDVGTIDDVLIYLIDKAGNYPPRFADLREKNLAASDVKAIINQLDPLAVHPNASFDVLMRAVKINQIARNMDLGAQSAIKAGVYMRRAIALNPDNALANYWYGTMLSEGGGIKEGIPYLNRAAQAGHKKAYLALAQAYLHINQRPNALSALESYHTAEPEQQAWTASLIEQVRAGKSLIWGK
ncbi:MAG: hypothetical protein VXW65_02460 [Pseudomonadota bacterium]|nr:hypothetical protein [Pseudomonadota bacterium]